MFLSNIISISKLKIHKHNISNNIIVNTFNNSKTNMDPDILNIVDLETFNSLKSNNGNFLIYGVKDNKVEINNKINYFISEIDDLKIINDILNTEFFNFNKFIFSIYDFIAKDKGLNIILETLKDKYSSNVCILDNSKKLIYNIFDFKKVNNIFPLKITKKNSSRVYGYLAFENIPAELYNEITEITNILNNYIYNYIVEFVSSKDKFYTTIKKLCVNSFSDDDDTIIKSINWSLNDNYSMYCVDLDGGLFKYRDMFIHGNKFILDHPMYLYSIIENNTLLLLLNESKITSNKIKNEINEYIKKYNLKYSHIYLKKNLLNFYKAYNLAMYILDNNLNIEENIDDNLSDLIFSRWKDNDFINIALPEELIYLKENDNTKNSELLKTLYFYLIEERSLLKASKQMGIHRNSIVYRINKINELVDIDLENAKVRHNLLIALEILNKLNPGLID